MAHAMMPASESAFGQNIPDRPVRESMEGYFLQYRHAQQGITVEAFRGADRADGLIRWVIGAGVQGQTPLVSSGGDVLQSRVSYFPQIRRFGVTVGQDAGASATAKAALGIKMNAREVRTCLGCHSTGENSGLEPMIPGVQCERCHTGAEEHARGHGIPFNPGKLSAADQARFCGSCHRFKPPESDTAIENVRFQPLRLMKSRCFASGKLSCTTCHPAHQDARRNDAAFYNEKCHACHDGQGMHADARREGDCIACHMPYVQLHPALKFTDHFIRIVKRDDLPEDLIRQRPSGS